MDKIEEHFEGSRRPNRTRRALLGIGFVVFLAFVALFIKMSLPSPRSELVGKWKGVSKTGVFMNFKSDGTFTGEGVEPYVGGNPILRIAYSGTWRASHNALYLTYSRYDCLTKHVDDRMGFKRAQNDALARPVKLEIEWLSDRKWSFTNTTGETYVRN